MMRTTRTARLAFPLLASSLLAVVPACDDSPDLDADFAKSSKEDRVLVAGAARGDAFVIAAVATGLLAESGKTTKCPSVTVTEKKTTLKGGCDAGNGIRIEGSATIDGVGSAELPDDATTPVRFSWDNLTITKGSDKVRFDGEAHATPKGDKAETSVDLEIEAAGKLVQIDATLTCTKAGACAAAADSYVTFRGIGTAEIKGSWTLSDTAHTGALELAGKDVLRVDFATAAPAGCYAATIGGKATDAVCLDQEDDEGGDDTSTSLTGVLEALSSLQ